MPYFKRKKGRKKDIDSSITLIHEADPQSRPVVITISTRGVCPVRPHFSKPRKNKIYFKRELWLLLVGLAEWIIHGTCSLTFMPVPVSTSIFFTDLPLLLFGCFPAGNKLVFRPHLLLTWIIIHTNCPQIIITTKLPPISCTWLLEALHLWWKNWPRIVQTKETTGCRRNTLGRENSPTWPKRV